MVFPFPMPKLPALDWPMAASVPVVRPEEESDGGLLARVQRGDHDAFAALLARHEAWARTYALRVVGRQEDAEDLVQEAFLELWRRALSFTARDSIRPLLAVLISRRGIDLLRRKRPASLDETVAEPVDHSADRMLERMTQEDRAKLMEAAIQKLPVRQRMAILLFHREELSLAQGAEALQMTPKAFESLLIRARAALKKGLGASF